MCRRYLERQPDEREQLDRPQGPKEGTVTESKIQSMDDLEAEMRAVARGEKPAPAHAARPSFESVEAVIRPKPSTGITVSSLSTDHPVNLSFLLPTCWEGIGNVRHERR
jgi:hypothetical protein